MNTALGVGFREILCNTIIRNPDPDHIPCYRVVNAKGELAENFAFGGIKVQKELLEAEGVVMERRIHELCGYGLCVTGTGW